MEDAKIACAGSFVSRQLNHGDSRSVVGSVRIGKLLNGDRKLSFEEFLAAVYFVPEDVSARDSLEVRMRAGMAAYAHSARRHSAQLIRDRKP
jgi:hypothetical protein